MNTESARKQELKNRVAEIETALSKKKHKYQSGIEKLERKITKRKKKLEKKVLSLEETLAQLKHRLEKVRESEQHEAIDHLETYLQEVDQQGTNLRRLWGFLQSEIKKLFNKNPVSQK